MILALFTVTTVHTVDVPESAYGHIANQVLEVTASSKVASIGQTEAVVRSYFEDIPIMIEVARCESQFRHELSDGSVLQGMVDPADTGVMQINKRYHLETAVNLDIDVDTIEGNLEYARYLYDKSGTQPWSASMPCWGNSLSANV